jgi:hypothetical protein
VTQDAEPSQPLLHRRVYPPGTQDLESVWPFGSPHYFTTIHNKAHCFGPQSRQS